MKASLSTLVTSLAVSLFIVSSLPVSGQDKSTDNSTAKSGEEAKPATAEPGVDDAGLKKAVDAVVRGLNYRDVQDAFVVMTDRGADRYIGNVLQMAIAVSGYDQEESGVAPEKLEQLRAIISKCGLDTVELPELLPSDFAELQKTRADTEAMILACIPEKDRRKKTQEIVAAMQQVIESPEVFTSGKIEITGERAEVAVMPIDVAIAAVPGEEAIAAVPGEAAIAAVSGEAAPLAESSEVIKATVVDYLVFVRKDGAWKFDGFNTERAMRELSAVQ